jgi:hypothetical protein
MVHVQVPNQPGVAIEYETTNEREFGPCPDCGQMTRRVWGWVYREDTAIAAYFVEWTPLHAERDAVFDLIVGTWGEAAGPESRSAVSVAYKVLETGPSFMVQDATERKIGSNTLVSHALGRSEVIGQPIAQEVFSVCDAIYLGDPRISELRP